MGIRLTKLSNEGIFTVLGDLLREHIVHREAFVKTFPVEQREECEDQEKAGVISFLNNASCIKILAPSARIDDSVVIL